MNYVIKDEERKVAGEKNPPLRVRIIFFHRLDLPYVEINGIEYLD